MKVKTISRPQESRASIMDIYQVQKNLQPEYHPFERAREYTRALNATKLSRLFAKPFLHSLTGHVDGVYSLAKHPMHITRIASGAGDGEIKIWSLDSLSCMKTIDAHKGFVRGLCFAPFSQDLISVGDDQFVRLWDHEQQEAKAMFNAKEPLTGVDHHRKDKMFATSSSQIHLWSYDRSEPVQTFNWGVETITCVKFNQTETSVLASCGTDRSIALYDLRSQSPISKVILALRTNSIAWNPMEAFNFSVANEDHHIYTFDMRNLSRSINILKDHVSAVLDLDYSPTGQEIVSGSYDKTIRIFDARQGKSREVYHTKRMQRIFTVRYSMDSKFILSGSDEGNIRLWKANASEKLGPLTVREKNARDYSDALKNRYKHMPEIRRIDRQRKVPNSIKNATKKKKVMLDSISRKENNMRRHSKPGSIPYKSERIKHVVTTQE